MLRSHCAIKIHQNTDVVSSPLTPMLLVYKFKRVRRAYLLRKYHACMTFGRVKLHFEARGGRRRSLTQRNMLVIVEQVVRVHIR